MNGTGSCALLVCSIFLAACGGGSGSVPAADRARAVEITTADELIGGPKSAGRLGDFLLANTKVRFVIAAAGRTRTWFPTGGAVLDADRVGSGAGDDRLQEMVTRLGTLRFLYADTVEIANDGSDGQDAVVRVTGHDVGVPLLQAVVPLPASNVSAITEYRLAPYAESLEVTTTVTNESGGAKTLQVGDLFVLGDFVTLYAPPYGTDQSTFVTATDLRYVAAFGGGVSYGYVAPGRQLAAIAPQGEVFGLATEDLVVPAAGSATFTRYLTVGTGDVASLLPAIVRREGGDVASLVTVTGTVVEEASGDPVAGATVEFQSQEGSYAIAVSAADGTYEAPLEPGDYTYAGAAPARPGSHEGSITVEPATAAPPQEVQVADCGHFTVEVDDAAGAPCPARLRFYTAEGTRAGQYLSADGRGRGDLPPGDYRAVVSRGYEWDAQEVGFTITAGAATTITTTLTRVVDTTGFIAVDPHSHTAMSADSQLDPRERVAQALADGVELVIATDHDVLHDLGPTVADMGITSGLVTVIGSEISPAPGHLNGYPLAGGPLADTDGYWALKFWREDTSHDFLEALWPKELFADLREKLGAQVVQINHPRSDSGILNWIEYDPTRGMAAVSPDHFDLSWDVLEVCNSGCHTAEGSDDAAALVDYFSFLNQAILVGAVGVSDAHGSSSLLGRARTMVAVTDDDPDRLDLDEVWASMQGGQAVVLDGPFVTATVADDGGAAVGMGGLAHVASGAVCLHVTVQAPAWIPTDTMRVIANGTEVQTMAIPAAGDPPAVVRFDGNVDVPAVTKDTWYVVIVDGASGMAPVLPGDTPRTITNAIFVDHDGNGVFDAPGL